MKIPAAAVTCDLIKWPLSRNHSVTKGTPKNIMFLPISLDACLKYIYPIVCSIGRPKAATFQITTRVSESDLRYKNLQWNLLMFVQDINKAYQTLQVGGPHLWPIVWIPVYHPSHNDQPDRVEVAPTFAPFPFGQSVLVSPTMRYVMQKGWDHCNILCLWTSRCATSCIFRT